MYITESLCCMAEINTIEINYISMKKISVQPRHLFITGFDLQGLQIDTSDRCTPEPSSLSLIQEKAAFRLFPHHSVAMRLFYERFHSLLISLLFSSFPWPIIQQPEVYFLKPCGMISALCKPFRDSSLPFGSTWKVPVWSMKGTDLSWFQWCQHSAHTLITGSLLLQFQLPVGCPLHLGLPLSADNSHLSFSACIWCSPSYKLPCCCSVAKLCLIFCDPMDCSMPGFPILHYLPEFAQTHVPWVDDAIQSSHPLSSTSPLALNLSQHQGLFQWVGSHRILWDPTLVRVHFMFYNFLFSCSISLQFEDKGYMALIHWWVISDQNFWLQRRIQKVLENELMVKRQGGLSGGRDRLDRVQCYIENR